MKKNVSSLFSQCIQLEKTSKMYRSLNIKEQNRLNDMYQKTYLILDKDFHAKFPIETSSRILELDVAYRLIEAFYDDVHNGSASKKRGGPDFLLNTSDKRIFIECVCAQDSNNDNVKQECIIKKSPNSPYIFTQLGPDKIKTSRISSSIKDKSNKIRIYRDQNVIQDGDIVLLVISTNFQKPDNKFITSEFDDVMASKAFAYYSESDGSESKKLIDVEDKRFTKNNEVISILDKDLDQFNAIIHADLLFDFHCIKNRKYYDRFNYKIYIRKQCDDCVKDIISKIFQSECIEYDNRYLYRKDNILMSSC